MCLQQVEICCHMNLWHRAIRKAGKVNKEDLHYHKPWYLKSIHQMLPASFAINHSSDSSQWAWIGGKGFAMGKSCSCEEGLFCLFPVLLEQLSTAKRPKTWAKFPCTSLFLTSSSYHSFSVAQWVFISPVLTCPDALAWILLPQNTQIAQPVAFTLPLLQAQHVPHMTKHIQIKGTPATLYIFTWSQTMQPLVGNTTFGSISSEGISFSDCLQESELPFANSPSFFSWLLCPPLKVYHAC